jgi:hypothetical protein
MRLRARMGLGGDRGPKLSRLQDRPRRPEDRRRIRRACALVGDVRAAHAQVPAVEARSSRSSTSALGRAFRCSSWRRDWALDRRSTGSIPGRRRAGEPPRRRGAGTFGMCDCETGTRGGSEPGRAPTRRVLLDGSDGLRGGKEDALTLGATLYREWRPLGALVSL